MVSYTLEGYAGTVEAYLALWERGGGREARRSAWWALAALGRIAAVYPVGRPRFLALLGTARHLAGRRVAARSAWRRSLRSAERLTMPFEEGLALLESARRLPRDDPDRRERLGRASALFGRLGATRFRDQANVV
jgi:hypothetical protein